MLGQGQIQYNDAYLTTRKTPYNTGFAIAGVRASQTHLCRVVMQHQNSKGEKITLATNELPAGIYFITVLDEDKTYTNKLIIE